MVAAGLVDVEESGVAEGPQGRRRGAGRAQERVSPKDFLLERFVKPAGPGAEGRQARRIVASRSSSAAATCAAKPASARPQSACTHASGAAAATAARRLRVNGGSRSTTWAKAAASCGRAATTS